MIQVITCFPFFLLLLSFVFSNKYNKCTISVYNDLINGYSNNIIKWYNIRSLNGAERSSSTRQYLFERSGS
jgi:hypothetical protein